MTMNGIILFLIVLVLHLTYAASTQNKITRTHSLSNERKRLNSILTWCIPFLWALLVRSIIKEPKLTVMTKNRRKPNSGGNTDDWGNLTGYDGGGSLGD